MGTKNGKVSPKKLASIIKGIVINDDACPIPVSTDGDEVARSAANPILIGRDLDEKELFEQIVESGYRHVLQNTADGFSRESGIASALIHKPGEFLAKPESFILENASSKKQVSVDFKESGARTQTLDKLLDFLTSLPGGSIHRDAVRTMADELFTNAMYNAPTDAKGNHLYSHQARTIPVSLADGKRSRIFIAHDNKRVLLGCVDPFGSLDTERLITKLYNSYRSEDLAQVNMGEGGAGIGCRMLVEHSTEFYIVCQKVKYTFFGCVMPLGSSAKAMDETRKNIYLVYS